MRRFALRRPLILIVALGATWTTAFAAPAQAPALRTAAPAIADFFRDYAAERVRMDPNRARATRFFVGAEQDRLERQLTPYTSAFRHAKVALARRGLARLAQFNIARLSDADRLSADIMRWQLQAVVDGEPFLDDYFPLNQFTGANVGLVEQLTVVHPLNTPRDAENYIAALRQVAPRMREAIAESRRLDGEGVLPPAFILRATIAQMQRFVADLPAENPYVTSFVQKTAGHIPDGIRDALRAQAEEIVWGDIYPAWTDGIALLQSQLPRASEDAGLWRLKNGDAAYRYYLHFYTTSDLTPDQVHQLGLQQVQAIDKKMDQLLHRLGRTEGTVAERIEKLRADMAYPNPQSEETRGQIMRDITDILHDAQRRSALLFGHVPNAAIIAQPYSRFEEANAQASYQTPPADGSRPGIFQYPLRVSEMTHFALRTTVYHETVPGHHFQLALQVENRDLPRFRQLGVFGGLSAFVEGWGLYAEHLAAEQGWYGDDLEGLLGELYWEQFRARRLVVDTGLHAMHWTRQQAIDYGIDPPEVERYVVYPGQADSYMVGELKLLELRDHMQKTLGPKFSMQQFHDLVLAIGAVPLEILEREVDHAIAGSTGKI